MTPKLFFSLMIGLCASLSSGAQIQQTLEISEVDTVLLNPTSIEYLVSPSLIRTRFDLEQNSKDKSGLGKTPATMVEVMKLLREHHINWVAGMRSGYAFGALTPAPDSSIIITAHSEAELQSLHALLSPLSGITASIGQVEFEPMPDRVTRYKIMYQRALADATGMATVSGKTLGELISVEEPQDLLWSSIRDMTQGMEMTANIFAALAGRSPGRLRKTVETKMLFKFELK